MPPTATAILSAVAFLTSAPIANAALKPNPIPDNYIQWTATLYADGEGLMQYEGSTETEVTFYWESGTQDVWLMYDEDCWKNCDFSYARQIVQPIPSEGDYTEASVDLASLGPGTHYLTAGVGSHCAVGQKMILTATKDEFANDASGWNAFVGAGAANDALGDWSTVGGGYNNRATGMSSTIMGGIGNNCISNYCTVSGGFKNAAKSRFATVLGGARNTAAGRFSLAAGSNARTYEDNSAAFGFSDEPCEVTTARTVAFCADSFFINDVNILATKRGRSLSEEGWEVQREALKKISTTVDVHQSKIADLNPTVKLQEKSFEILQRIEAKLASLEKS